MVYNMNRKLIVFISVIMLSAASCGNFSSEQKTFFNENIESIDSIRLFLESKYSKRLADSTANRHRITFVNCNIESKLSIEDYICADMEVIEWMNKLDIQEISFEKSLSNCNYYVQFPALIFVKRNNGLFEPGTYFVYEYCGTSTASKSSTFEYTPIDSHWSVQIDRN